MKKLFFTALVAVVAVGGALSSKAEVVGYEFDQDTAITCDAGAISCADLELYNEPASDPGAQTRISIGEYEDLLHN